MKKFILLTLALSLLLSLTACSRIDGGDTAGGDTAGGAPVAGEVRIGLSDAGITVGGKPAPEDAGADVYTAHDIVYYESGHDLTYGEGTAKDEHPASEAAAHTVLHIAAPGTYVLSGRLSAGQIAVDLGEGAEDDPGAVVTLVLSGVDITCTVAPAIIFYNVYECGGREAPSPDVDTSAAGANIVIADGTDNTVNGSYVARIYSSVELSADGSKVVDGKKLHKYDGAVYSKMSMNVSGGDGRLTINAENEGLDTELHLTVNGGVIDIFSGNDGINTNEDGVSVTTVNGGALTVTVNGSTGEGDGIDSNGWLVVNGGQVRAFACGSSMDSGIDSDMGIVINGGRLVATGNMLDAIDAASTQSYVIFNSIRVLSSIGLEDIGSFTLQDAEGAELMDFTVSDNAFSVLLVSSPELGDGLYSLYSGGTLVASAEPGVDGGTGGPGNGQRPPDGVGPVDPPPEVPDDELVRVTDYIPGILVDLRYASDNNFTGEVIYDFTEARLRYGTVKKLRQVQEELSARGYTLKIWDALRPVSAQFRLWEICPDGRYVSNPNTGYSKHSRGNTVDLTLVRPDGSEVPMPSDFDNFTALADRDYSDVPAGAAENARLLEEVMTAHGFIPYSAEWWHYTDEDSYDVVK